MLRLALTLYQNISKPNIFLQSMQCKQKNNLANAENMRVKQQKQNGNNIKRMRERAIIYNNPIKKVTCPSK